MGYLKTDYLGEQEDDYLTPLDDEEDDYTGGPTGNKIPVRPGFESTSFSSGFMDPGKPHDPRILYSTGKDNGLDSGAYSEKLSALERIMQQKPGQPQPKWWQRVLAGAAGAGIGYVNAGGRVRPIDARGVSEAILAPGHRRKMADWQQQMDTAKVGAEVEGKKLTALEQIQRIDNERKMRDAQIAADNARLKREERMMNAPSKVERQVVDGVVVERQQDGTWKPVYGSPAPREYKPGYGYEKGGQVEIPVPTPEKPGPRPLVGHPGTEFRDPNDPNKVLGRVPPAPERSPRPASTGSFRIIESEKQRNLMTAERNARKRITDGEDQATVMADLEDEKQRIQDGYEAQIEAAGGSAQHREYGSAPKPATPPQPKQRTAPVASAAPAYKPGDTVRLKSGKTVRITKINADGTFDYE